MLTEACNNNNNFLNAMMNLQALSEIAGEPFTLYKPKLFIDGDQWCALYGANLQEGVSGFGESPAEAVTAFNKAWYKKIPQPKMCVCCEEITNENEHLHRNCGK